MKNQSRGQKKTMRRVMHEFKEGGLRTKSGKKVKNRKQAVAIGLSESGASKYATKAENERNLRHTKEKERKGQTGKKKKRQ